MQSKELTLEQCREVAARIWCDQLMRTHVMNVDIAENIAQLLFANQQLATTEETNDSNGN